MIALIAVYNFQYNCRSVGTTVLQLIIRYSRMIHYIYNLHGCTSWTKIQLDAFLFSTVLQFAGSLLLLVLLPTCQHYTNETN